MAFYKQQCMHCQTLIDRDSRYCPTCGSNSPFTYLCPACLRVINKDDPICGGCGRPLYTACPACQRQTFVQQRCEHCGADLMIRCQNPRCGVMQFFENTRCTACGKKIKKALPKARS